MRLNVGVTGKSSIGSTKTVEPTSINKKRTRLDHVIGRSRMKR